MLFSSYPQLSVPNLKDSYDYVIIGGGTAGCVLANRLSQNPGVSVLLVERGGVQNSWIARIPLFSSHFASDGSRSYVFRSTAQEHVDHRRIDVVGGNSMGGASKINAMLYTRGLPAEYNSWSQAGCQGWSYHDMEPYFVKSESDLDRIHGTVEDYHGTSGEWPHRSHGHSFWQHTHNIIQGTDALGLPYVDDLNSPLQPSHGCAKMHYTLDSTGQRSSTLTAFLPMHLVNERKRHLHICTWTVIQRIEVTNKAGRISAEGVWIHPVHGSLPSRFIRARREVILTAGPIMSPKILMLSGIGPEGHLKEHGIPVMRNLPGVGSGLQDHISVPVQFRVPREDSLTKLILYPWLVFQQLFLYSIFGTGLLLAPVIELSIFLQSRLFDAKYRVVTRCKADTDATLPRNRPDIEIMPISWGNVLRHFQGGLSFFIVTLRPQSVGTVRLSSSDPRANPIVDPNYFSTEQDREVMRKGVRFALRLKEVMASQKYSIADSKVPRSEGDNDIDEFVRRECMSTAHFASTCRMAPEEDAGVVDDRLRVHGVEGLRIGDSSIFPQILSTHLVAGTVAIAEKCADMIGVQYECSHSKKCNGY